jgi:DNA-binding XRE family transcriptional regulator
MDDKQPGVSMTRPERFLVMRRRLGLDQDDLARFLGVTSKSIGNWEAKKDGEAISRAVCLAMDSVGISGEWLEKESGDWLKPGFTIEQVRESIINKTLTSQEE